VLQTFFAQCAVFHLEKLIYMQVLLGFLVIIAVFQFSVQYSASSYYNEISQWMDV